MGIFFNKRKWDFVCRLVGWVSVFQSVTNRVELIDKHPSFFFYLIAEISTHLIIYFQILNNIILILYTFSRTCIFTHIFKYIFSIFKQYYTYFYTFFYPHVFLHMFLNNKTHVFKYIYQTPYKGSFSNVVLITLFVFFKNEYE